MTSNKWRKILLGRSFVVTAAVAGAMLWDFRPSPAKAPIQLEYLPKDNTVLEVKQASAETPAKGVSDADGFSVLDFEAETVGSTPQTFVPVVGNWVVGQDGSNRVLVVDGRAWSRGQTAAGIADRARSLYGERYAEFLDNVQAFAYFPYAVAAGIENFCQGEIRMRFKGIDGRIDQAAGILFNVKQNGDYLALRANPLENNLVLWKFEQGKRSSVKWVKNVPTPARQWHDLKLIVTGTHVEGYVNGKLYLEHTLTQGVSGRVGVWSKADSVVYFDRYAIRTVP